MVIPPKHGVRARGVDARKPEARTAGRGCPASPAADVAAPSGACFAAATTARTHVRAADRGGPPACDHHRPSPATITAAPEGASPRLPHNANTTHRALGHGMRGQKRAAVSSHRGWCEGEGKRGSARHQSRDHKGNDGKGVPVVTLPGRPRHSLPQS